MILLEVCQGLFQSFQWWIWDPKGFFFSSRFSDATSSSLSDDLTCFGVFIVGPFVVIHLYDILDVIGVCLVNITN